MNSYQEADDLGDGIEKKLKIVKKKSPTIEENKSKKEHVNVVFIGHVGMFKRKQNHKTESS